MSCEILEGIVKGCESNSGGIRQCWVNTMDQIDIDTFVENGSTYEITEGELAVGGDPYVELEFNRNVSSYTEEAAIDLINGSSFFNQTITLVFHRRQKEKSEKIKFLGAGQQYLTAIVKDTNGLYWFFSDLQLTTVTEGSGVTRADGSKYQITLAGESLNLAMEIAEANVDDLI